VSTPGRALIEVAGVPGVPNHPVVAGLAERLVVISPAGQHVVARPAEQDFHSALAKQRVVPGLAGELVLARAAGERVAPGPAEQVGRR